METQVNESLIESPMSLSKSISVRVENKSDKVKSVNIFSPQTDNDIVISVFDDTNQIDHEKFIKDLSESKSSMVTSGIKIYGTGMEDFLECMVVGGKKFDSADYELMPLLYMSPYQMMEEVVYVYPYNMWIESGFDATVKVRPNTKITCCFIIGAELKDKNDSKSKQDWVAIHGAKSIYGNCIPILIENPTDESIYVKLFDIDYFESNPPAKISTTAGLMSYGGMIEMLKDDNGARRFKEKVSKFNSLKIWSDNRKQFGRRWQREGQMLLREFHEEKDGERIFKDTMLLPYYYFTPHQIQSNLLDIAGVVKYEWDKDCFIEISMLPKTKALYLFYELISDRERYIADFELENKNTLERLKLKLVREE